MTESSDQMISSREAARIMGIAPGTLEVWRSRRKGDQPEFFKIRRSVRYSAAAVREWVASHRQSAAGDDHSSPPKT